jgi:hypothetical protein
MSRRAPTRRAGVALALAAASFAFVWGCSSTAGVREASAAGPAATLGELQRRYNRSLYDGLVALRSRVNPAAAHVVGDNTGPAGMLWTKCANLGVDLLATLVAESRGLVSDATAREHVSRVLDVLGALPRRDGIFPEVIKLENGIRAEIKDGRISYSSIDSAWVTIALSLVETRYRGSGDPLAAQARALLDAQNYAVFLTPEGVMGGGFWIDAQTGQRIEDAHFAYADRNSEARPLVNALVGLGKIPTSAWDGMTYVWDRREDVPIARGWNFSAFVEMTGQLFLDEASLSPRALGLSHANYVEASVRGAARRGDVVFGYAPACNLAHGYAEYGLDRPEVVSPYAAAALAMTGEPRAVANLARILEAIPSDGRPAPDGLVPSTGRTYCAVARTLDQSLLFLALNADALRALSRGAAWYPSAAARIRASSEAPRPSPTPAPGFGAGRTGARTPVDDGQHDSPPVPDGLVGAARAEAVERGRAGLREILSAVRQGQGEPGGAIAVSQSRVTLASASAFAAWMDFLPDFAAIGRRRALTSAPSAGEPDSWFELQGRETLSLEKITAGIAASKAKGVASASVRQSERDTDVAALRLVAALYVAERQSAALQEHAEWLRGVARQIPADAPDAPGDSAVLAARIAAVDHALAESEAARRGAASQLRDLAGDRPLRASAVDVALDLADVVSVFGGALNDLSRPEEVGRAELDWQESLLSMTRTRAAYLPELRAGLLADWTSYAAAGGRGWAIDQVLGDVTAAFRLRPDSASLREAQEAAVEASYWRLRELRRASAEARAEARVRRDAAQAAWSATAPERSAARYRRAADRFARGEDDVTALTDASRRFQAATERSAQLLSQALDAEIERVAQGGQETIAGPTASDVPTLRSPLESAAQADVARTAATAEALTNTLQSTLEGGVVWPLSLGTGAPLFGAVIPSREPGGTTLTTGLLHPALLGRAALARRSDSRAERAAQAKASLARARAEEVRKMAQAQQVRARVEWAYARAALHQAEAYAVYARKVVQGLEPLLERGLLDAETFRRDAGARLEAAVASEELARGAMEEARIRLDTLRAAADDEDARDETLSELTSRLESRVYAPEHLVGFEAELRERTARLRAAAAQAELAASRASAASLEVTVQGTLEFDTKAYSLGFAVSCDLDPARDEAHVLEVADDAGRAEGELASALADVARDRLLSQEELDAATRISATEATALDSLQKLASDSQQELAGRPELDDTTKLRTSAGIEDALFEARRRVLVAEHRLARARLRALDLGLATTIPRAGAVDAEARPNDPATHPTPSAEPLSVAIARLAASDPLVVSGDRAYRAAVAEPLRWPLFGGFRAFGPIVGLAHGDDQTGGSPSSLTTAVTGAIAGIGISYGLDEGLAFIASYPRRAAAGWAEASARRVASVDAARAIGQAWYAREKLKLAGEAAEQARAFYDLTLPRFSAAHVGFADLARAQASEASARADDREAQDEVDRERLWFSLRGVPLTDELLDTAAQYVASTPPVAPGESPGHDPPPAITQARAARDAARGDALLAFARLVGPATIAVWANPFVQRDRLAQAGAPAESTTRGVDVDVSLAVPILPKALAQGAEASARAGVRDEDLARTERFFHASRSRRQDELDSAIAVGRAAAERERTARVALDEVDRRYQSADVGISIDTRRQAEDDVLAARRAVLDSQVSRLRLVLSEGP